MATIYNDTWRLLARKMMGYEHNALQKEIYDWWISPEAGQVCLIMGGERSGKSLLTADLLLATVKPGTPEKEALYWIVGPDYVQARPEFSYLLSAFQNAGLVSGSPSMPQGVAQPWSFQTQLHQTFLTKTSTDVKKLASFSVNGLAMTEAHQQDHEVYLKLLGRLSETRGAMIMSGTLERGLPWYLDLYKRWRGENAIGARSFSMPTWSNTAVYPGGEEDPAILQLRAEYPEDLFMERFGAVPRTHYNAVIPEFDTAIHVRKLAIEENVPIELWVDPGKLVYCVLFVQVIGPYTHVLDRVYATGKIAQEVIPDVMAHRLFKYVNPEQAGVIDFAAKQEHGNKSQLTLWNEIAGCRFRYQYLPEEKLRLTRCAFACEAKIRGTNR
jgi:hypothetical protein